MLNLNAFAHLCAAAAHRMVDDDTFGECSHLDSYFTAMGVNPDWVTLDGVPGYEPTAPNPVEAFGWLCAAVAADNADPYGHRYNVTGVYPGAREVNNYLTRMGVAPNDPMRLDLCDTVG